MELRQLQYFVKAAEMGHFTNAAKALYITQPALSQSLKYLETDLGRKLFARQGQGVRLTDGGEVFLEYAKEALLELDRMQTEICNMKEGTAGEILLGTSIPVTSFNWLHEILNDFMTRHPNVSFDIFSAPQNILLELLDEHKLDFAITTDEVFGEYDYTYLYREPLCVLLPKNDMLTQKDIITRGDLAERNFLLDNENRDLHNRLSAVFAEERLPLNIIFEGSYPQSIIRAVAANRGITIFSEAYYQQLLSKNGNSDVEDSVVLRPLQIEGLYRTIGLATSKGSLLIRAVCLLKDEILCSFQVKEL